MKNRSERLIADRNSDDGDRNFDRGLISNRVDSCGSGVAAPDRHLPQSRRLRCHPAARCLGFPDGVTPTYFQVATDLDIDVPLTLSYTPQGKSPLPFFNGPHKGGTMGVGVSALYRRVWNVGLQFIHFYGGVSFQALKDRDFVSLSIQRTF